ncbi:hypothetical protein AB0L82_03860 [Nocardia sp. NPDC052001]|uniref:hypothetical protein n=1 Tax=Nocardia sp. NPDC052001 TaxID=3154853 RepID=UPI00341B8238
MTASMFGPPERRETLRPKRISTAAGRTGVVLRFGVFCGPGAARSAEMFALADATGWSPRYPSAREAWRSFAR